MAVLFYGSLEPATSSYAADELKAFSSALDSLSGTRMLADIETLSGLEYEGRQTGTSGDIKAAGFVSRRFASLGLRVTPLSFSASDLPAEPGTAIPTVIYSIGNSPRLEVLSSKYRRTGQVPTDYLPILDSPSLNIEAPVAFVGYGISDPERGYDDYAGLNVRDHVVLFLRGKPDHYPAQISHAEKVRIAREKGAMAYLTVTGPLLSAYESRRGMTTTPSAFYGRHGGDQSLAGAWITPAFADLILAGSSEDDFSLHSLQETMNRSRRPASRLTASSVHMVWEAGQRPGTLYNVIAMLPGSDPKLRDQPVILGAHRDHFGHQAGQTFPGADDNASGTAVILEVARALAEMNPSKRTVVFVSFSGEEQGMVGSQFYVKESVKQTDKPEAMINIDHAGIGNGRLTVGVTGLEKNVAMEAGQRAGLAERLDLFGFFPGGDHVPFKEAGVPTITIVSGGPHPHFHKTTDTVETIDPNILQTTARYVLALTWQLANQQ